MYITRRRNEAEAIDGIILYILQPRHSGLKFLALCI